jgi:hypothetical protein
MLDVIILSITYKPFMLNVIMLSVKYNQYVYSIKSIITKNVFVSSNPGTEHVNFGSQINQFFLTNFFFKIKFG